MLFLKENIKSNLWAAHRCERSCTQVWDVKSWVALRVIFYRVTMLIRDFVTGALLLMFLNLAIIA